MREPQRPVFRSRSLVSRADAGALAPKSTNSCWESAFTRIASNFLFSPRAIPHTVPLTGVVNRISGRCLSAITGEPAFTVSPSFTRRRATRPLKSVGFTATMSGTTVLMTSGAATPFRGMLRPFFKARWFDIIFEVLCISKNTSRSYEKFANFAPYK